MLFPDDWSMEDDVPSGITLTTSGVNTITAANWHRLEAVGAVFLPAAGYRIATESVNIWQDFEGNYKVGYYWTNLRAGGSSEAKYMQYSFYSDRYAATLSSADAQTHFGHSVRLVKSAPGYNMTGRWN
ncbi:MAG: hypothetical protein IJK84_06290 [Bacteroidales bacterium]|nr:hypothetical protein [Bacteroidales bacterium]